MKTNGFGTQQHGAAVWIRVDGLGLADDRQMDGTSNALASSHCKINGWCGGEKHRVQRG